MVPLAPHPCVRWWNTEEMSLKLTRLGLHSLRGGSTHQNHPISVGAGSVWVVGVWQPYGCVVVRDHSLPGQRMAPHTPQESPKVKTRWVRIGSYRLYAPMVPLALYPCVRWWNTKEITLKLTRLCLHSLRGGSSYQKPSHLRRDGFRLDGGCVGSLWVCGRGGPFFAGPKNGPPHPRRKPQGQDQVF